MSVNFYFLNGIIGDAIFMVIFNSQQNKINKQIKKQFYDGCGYSSSFIQR